MKTVFRISVLGIGLLVMLFLDVAPLQLVPEAHAILGVRRRTARRTAVVMGSANAAAASSQQAQQQQAAAAPAETAPPPAPAPAPAAAPAPAPAAAPGALPLGTVVTALPAGCAAITIGGIQYQKCGVDYYKAAFQGSNLVYVTTQP